MKTKRLLTYALAIGLATSLTADVRAQDRAGTAGAQQLLIPVTARTAALGAGFTSSVPGANGLEGLYANPAALTVNGGTNALFSRMNYFADIGVNYFGIAQNFGANNVGLTVTAWDFGDIPLQTEEDPEITDVTWSASFITVGAAYARQFTDRISGGVNFKIVNERIDDMSSSGVAFDAGITYAVAESGLRFGVSLKNFGFSRNYDGTGLVRFANIPGQNPDAQPGAVEINGAQYELPSLLNFGVSYTREVGQGAVVSVLGNFRSNSFSENQYAGGLEAGYQNLFYVRGGYEFQQDMDQNAFMGWSLGAGFNLEVSGNGLSIDYAYRPAERLSNVQMITAAITL